MNPDVLRHHDFWSMADRAADSPGGNAAKVLADWLDEHDSPLRAHLLRFGSPEHNIRDVQNVWRGRTEDRPGALLHDEGRHPRFLRGHWNPDTLEDYTVPRTAYQTGPETYELFDGESTINPGAPSRHVVRYTLLLPGGKHLRVIAPVSTGHIAEIGRAFDEQNNPDDGEIRQTPWNGWHAALQLDTHPTLRDQYTEEPTKLARVILQPGVPHRPTHTGEAVFRHELHDEAGAPVGVLHVSPRNDGRTVHVHWAGRSESTTGEEGNTLGAEAIGGIRTGLAEHYPDAEFVSGHRGGGTAGQTGFRGPGERELVVKPLRRPLRLARMQASANGTIVNNQYQRGGQFLAKARKRIRDVVAGLVKLARPNDTSAAGLFGRSPHEESTERPLTLGELKDIEDAHKLPEKQRLSPHVTQTVVGDEHPYSANTENIRWLIHNVSRAALPTETLRKTLARRDLPMGAKLTHLVANMKADYEASHKGADAIDGSWYKGQIDEMEKHLHGLAGGKPHPLWGDMDPETGELKGKHDPAENHPGVVIFKALLAATSGSQNPNDNMLSAARAWAAGRRRGHPIVDMPDYNTDALEEWVAKAKRLHGIKPSETDREAALRTPGTTDFQRAKWWNKWVKPYAAELDAKMDGAPPGYAAAEARVNPNHQIVWEMGGNGEKEKKGGADVRGYTTPGSLPLINPDGTLRTKGWGTRGEQAASGIASLKVLFEAARRHDPEGTEASHFRWVARWLLSDHDAKEFKAVADVADHMRGQLPSLGAASFAHGKHAAQGWFKRGESVPGMFVLGPKFGAFGMNLNSNHPAVEQKYRRFLTADLWFTRNWARYLGQMFRGRKRKSFEAPTSRDRRQMALAIHDLCKDLGVHPADLQADLWYHEQALYRMLGADPNRTGSVSYGQAAGKYLDRRSPTVLRDRQGKVIQLARTIPPTDPELRDWWAQIRSDDGYGIDHTAAKVLADRLEELGDWRHHLLRHTAQYDPSLIGDPRYSGVTDGVTDGIDQTMYLYRGQRASIYHIPGTSGLDAPSSRVSRGVDVRTGTPRVYVNTTHPIDKSRPSRRGEVHSVLTPEEYEALRAEAKTADVHFPKVPTGPTRLARAEDEQEAFHRAMAKDPNDATTRAVYADWLDEHDMPVPAARLRWWAQVLPHMPTRIETLQKVTLPVSQIRLPQWASELAVNHYRRMIGTHADSDRKDELRALGLHERFPEPVDTGWSAARWLHVFRTQNPTNRYNRAAHAVAAQDAATSLGLETPQ